MTRAALERAKGVAMLQAELLVAEAQQSLHDEKQFYTEVSHVLSRRDRVLRFAWLKIWKWPKPTVHC